MRTIYPNEIIELLDNLIFKYVDFGWKLETACDENIFVRLHIYRNLRLIIMSTIEQDDNDNWVLIFEDVANEKLVKFEYPFFTKALIQFEHLVNSLILTKKFEVNLLIFREAMKKYPEILSHQSQELFGHFCLDIKTSFSEDYWINVDRDALDLDTPWHFKHQEHRIKSPFFSQGLDEMINYLRENCK